jgi:uncharacterized protein (DUF1501 family)
MTAMDCPESACVSRRGVLAGSASLALWSFMPRAAIAGTRDPRLLTIVLRGGLDGLSLAAPVGDPDYAVLRSRLALRKDGEHAGLPLDGFFVLNRTMPYLHGLYQKREALIVHAVATPYRGRSHFDGQDILESGTGTGRTNDGWLNRALAGMSTAGKAEPQKGLAIGAVAPLIMRGAAPVLTWTPKAYSQPLREATIARLMDLYARTDPKLAKAFAEGLEIDRMAEGPSSAVKVDRPAAPQGPGQRSFQDFVETAEAAARFMTSPGGPRIGALSFDGWDTHANEGAITGLLANRLAGLDAALKVFGEGMGAGWKDTVVLLVTEFGRTAAINGTDGTDHGTATTALLLGGAVKGGRVLADWPGLSGKALYEGRDLMPTRDLRGLIKGVLRDHLGVPSGALDGKVFPGSTTARTIDGLLV